MAGAPPLTAAAALAAIDGGHELAEGDLLRLLRSPHCPGALVERLAACRWLLRLRRPLTAVVRHPACPRTFAWDALPRLGWGDLLGVSRDPRASPAIRKQAERRLVERIPRLSVGERVSLARQAPRGIFAALILVAEAQTLTALLDNPQFTEVDVLRIASTAARAECLSAVLHHPSWGTREAVVVAALRNPVLPLGLALGLAAALTPGQLHGLLAAGELPAALRPWLGELLGRSRSN